MALTVRKVTTSISDAPDLGPIKIQGDEATLERCTIDAQYLALYACEIGLKWNGRRARGTRFVDCIFKNADKLLVGSYFECQGCLFEEAGNDAIFANGPGGSVNGIGAPNVFRKIGSIAGAKKIAVLKGKPYQSPHGDAVQTNGYRAWRVVGNDFQVRPDAAYLTNSCVYIEAEKGDAQNTLVNGNRLDGGNYCVSAIDWVTSTGVKGRISPDVWILNNEVVSFRYGPFSAPRAHVSGNITAGAINYP